MKKRFTLQDTRKDTQTVPCKGNISKKKDDKSTKKMGKNLRDFALLYMDIQQQKKSCQTIL